MSKTVALVGLNGALGKPTLDALLSPLFSNKYQLPVHALTRDRHKLSESDEKVKYFLIDYRDASSLDVALNGVSELIDVTAASLDNRPLVDAAVRQNVQVYFPSSYKTDYEAAGLYLDTFSACVRNLQYARSSGIPKVVDVVVGFFADWSAERGILFNFDASKNFYGQLGDGDQYTAVTSLRDIGRTLASLAYRDDIAESIKVAGDHITTRQFGDIYDKYNNVTLTRRVVPVEQVLQLAEVSNQKYKDRDHYSINFMDFFNILRAILVHPSKLNDLRTANDNALVNPGLWTWDSYENVAKAIYTT